MLAVANVALPAFAHEADTLSPLPPTAPSPLLPSADVTPSGKMHKVWPWVLIGAGALTLGGGIWVVHKEDSDPSMPACTTSPLGRTTCPYSTASKWQGWGLIAVGAELAAAGIVWEAIQLHREHRSVSLAIAPGGLVGTF
ncbi:MAG TPA: hypothetical protein VH560_13045 [Polyangia bacterium]|nr:hypothetical protein [Polyangia bacterium]